ncbi:unknown [Crocosphaera subtropica ATCC 51142]|uniref:FAD-binding PCMH-type domain-containing protein n=1 Tax=Crocosphaera subtropica (strain ATCC 51142 / BH68) TaxID=43989 RepID=B1WZV8_CROS5|nr:xanthine dehydrogenase family protein subunit M [Crocosphaera subtropica]ACB52857.1 unknown [Crocosphaera subtropica ATCC 51142]
MNNFTYCLPESPLEAANQKMSDPDAQFIAGGTNLVDRLKVFLDQPSQLIDISNLALQTIETTADGGLRLGALATNTAVAQNKTICHHYPMLARAILSGASQQIRNMATVGGNLLQRTRCPYYYDTAFPCNKREPETGCPAIDGMNRNHAILGSSDQCVAVHPSDMCVALAALDAVVEVMSAQGQRQIPFCEFHRLPGNRPDKDTYLEPGELITAVTLPHMSKNPSGVYLKIRDRTSYAFALISVAASVNLEGDKIEGVRLALGGVAHKPWRATETEDFLIGKSLDDNILTEAAEIALQDAKPLSQNQFKVELAKRAIIRALKVSAQGGGVV